MRSLIFDLFLLEQAQAQAHIPVNEAILKLEKGACGYYAFDVAEGDKQLPETETSSTIRAYGSGASTVYLDVSLVGNQRTFTIINDSNSELVVKASDEGQTVTIYPSGVKKVVRMNDDVIKLASLIGSKAEDVSALQNWNNVLDTGFYRGTGMLNKPEGSGHWQYCMVIQHDPSFVVQLFFDYGSTQAGSNNAWIRWRENNTWTVLKNITTAGLIAHAQTHIDGTDDIQLATSTQKGLMSSAYAAKLDGIEANANNYIHPATHSLDMITETSTLKIMTADERYKLATMGGIPI